MYALADLPPVESYTAETLVHRAPAQLVAQYEPTKIKRPVYLYKRSVLAIEGGKVLLRLTQPLSVAVDPTTMECEVLGWDVHLPASTVEDVPKALARRFLQLFSKADSEGLNEQEQAVWMTILDQVDFAAFCIDRAAPHYVEGTLRRLEPVCLVEWHDGEVQKIDPVVARTLNCLRPGDDFGAYIKLGKENRVLSIERLVLF